MTKNPGGSDSNILLTYAALSSSCYVQYIYYNGHSTLNEMIIDIILIRIWHTISTL